MLTWNNPELIPEERILSGHSDTLWGVAVSKNKNKIVSGGMDKTVKIWNANTGDVLCTLSGHDDYVTAVAMSEDDMTVISGYENGTVQIWKNMPNGSH